MAMVTAASIHLSIHIHRLTWGEEAITPIDFSGLEEKDFHFIHSALVMEVVFLIYSISRPAYSAAVVDDSGWEEAFWEEGASGATTTTTIDSMDAD